MKEEATRELARPERHRKEVLEDAFSILLGGKSCSALSPGKVVIITESGVDLSINLELLTLFSPFVRSLLSSLSRDSYKSDSSPVLILPQEISTDVVLKLNSLLTKGKAKFRNGLESREVLEAAELLGINIKELHRENGQLFAATPPRTRKGKRGATQSSNASPIIAATSSIKKEKIIEIDDYSQDQDAPQPLAVTYEGFNQASTSSSSVVACDPPSAVQELRKEVFYPCVFCNSKKKYVSIPQLYSHYIGTHFVEEISSYIKDDQCSINNCGKSYPKKGKLELHIGLHHKKIHEILNREGIRVKGIPVTNPTSNNVMDPYVFVPSPKKGAKNNVSNPVDSSTLSSKGTPKKSGAKAASASQTTKPKRKSPITTKSITPRKRASPASKSTSSPNCLDDNLGSVSTNEESYPVAKIPGEESYATPNRESLSRKRETSGSLEKVNYELQCEVCGQRCKSPMLLEQHMVKHFTREVEALVSKFAGEAPRFDCSMCGDVFKQRNGTIVHLGSKHGFINEVLKEKQLSVLPVTVNNSGYSAAKQKQLFKIKTERADYDEGVTTSHDDIRRELISEANTSSAGQENVNVTMEEIFEKYKEHIN